MLKTLIVVLTSRSPGKSSFTCQGPSKSSHASTAKSSAHSLTRQHKQFSTSLVGLRVKECKHHNRLRSPGSSNP
jgi:hypothetical protein